MRAIGTIAGSRVLFAIAILVAVLGAGCCHTFERFSVNPACPGFELPRAPVMIFYVDGLRPDILEEMAQNGELPLLKRYILDRAASVENAITSVPAITYGNATAMVSGLYPSHHAIAANKWFDRERLVCRNYESRETMVKVNLDLERPTIYEMLDDKLTAVIGMQLNKGSKLHYVVSADDGGLPAGLAWTTGQQEEVDEIMAENIAKLGKEARRLGHWPDLALIYFPGPDDVAHAKGAQSSEYRSALRSLDESLGAMLAALDGGGLLDRITLVLTSDHGMHDVHRQQWVDLGRLAMESGLSVYTDDAEVDEDLTYLHPEEGFAASIVKFFSPEPGPPSYPERFRRFHRWRMVLTHSGERQAFLHVRSGWNWAQRPSRDEILWSHREAANQTAGTCYAASDLPLPEIFVRHPAVGFAVVRDGQDAVEVFGKVGVGRIERSRSGAEPSFRYRVISGSDPIFGDDAAAPAIADGELHGSREWLQATAALAHPDVVPQFGSLFDHHRTGDVALFAAPGWDFSKKYLGGHGGIERDEMRIPFYFAGPTIAAGTRVPAARLVDLVPTVLELMGLADRTTRLCALDGKSIASQLAPEGAASSRSVP
jgi:arylsulfatase A-like enzyme